MVRSSAAGKRPAKASRRKSPFRMETLEEVTINDKRRILVSNIKSKAKSVQNLFRCLEDICHFNPHLPCAASQLLKASWHLRRNLPFPDEIMSEAIEAAIAAEELTDACNELEADGVSPQFCSALQESIKSDYYDSCLKR